MAKLTLSKLESHLRNLVEGSTDWLFPSAHNGRDLASQMAKAMQGGIRINPDGEAVAPNLFTIEAHPDQAEMMAADQAFCEGLTQILRQQGEEAGLRFSSPLAIRIIPANDLALGELRAQARHSLAEVSKTDAIPVESGAEIDPSQLPPNAFLIVDGTRIFTLNQAVVNIGRRADNQLVINDERISRLHAQLRLVGSSFAIFDLDSTGGTFVNGQRIHQATLQAGDVISLSGLPLVYGQDAAPGEATQQMIANP
jgi:hypothetical protein